MATWNTDIQWTTRTDPKISIKYNYSHSRSGSDMIYYFSTSVDTLPTSTSSFGFPIYVDIFIDANQVVEKHTIKDVSPSRWAARIDTSYGPFTVSNKTSGSTSVRFRVYSGSGSSRDDSQTFSAEVDPAASQIGTVQDFNFEDAFVVPVTKYVQSYSDTLSLALGSTTFKTVQDFVGGSTVSLTDSELLQVYNTVEGTSDTVTLTITTYDGSTSVGSTNTTAVGSISGAIRINKNGEWVRAIPWYNDGGTWKRCVVHVNDNGAWKRGV